MKYNLRKIIAKTSQLHAIQQVSNALVSNLTLDEVLKLIIKSAAEIVPSADCGSVLLLDDNKELSIEALYGYDDKILKKKIKPGTGYSSIAIAERRVITINDLPKDPRDIHIDDIERVYPIKCAISVPLIAKDKVLGVISLENLNRTNAFVKSDVDLLSYFASLAAIAIENTRLYEMINERVKEAILLYKATEELSSALALDEVLNRVLAALTEIFHYDSCAIRLYDEEKQELLLKAATGYAAALKRSSIKLTDNSLNSWVAQNRELVNAPDVSKDPRYLRTVEETRSQIVIPLHIGEKLIGTLDLESSKLNAFGGRDVRVLMALAVQISIAIENAGLFEETRKQAEKLKESEHKYRTLVEKAHDVVLIIQDDKLKYANQRFVDLSGYSLEESSQVDFLELIAPPYRELVAENHRRHLEGENIAPYEIDLIKKDGSLATLELTASRIEYEGKHAALIIARDVVEANRLRWQLLQSEKLAAIGQLVSGVAHELNNPLASVLGFSQLILMRSKLDDTTRKYLDKVYSEAERATKIVRNLLAFARQHKPGKNYVDVNKILEETLALRAYELKVNNIEIVRDFACELPWLFGDAHQLQQVFLNIIINAEQAMLQTHGQGKLVLKTTVNPANEYFQDKSEYFVRIEFLDNGPGISKQNLSRIFDPFFTTKTLGRGTGLGLSISYGIIQEHSGRIYVESEEGKGAKFIVELPFLKQEVADLAPKEVPKISVKIDKKHILIVDDEPAIVELVGYILRDEGHKVDGALDVAEAIQRLNKRDYDLIISDVKMPKLSGKEFYFILKEQKPEILPHLIFMTGDIISPETAAFFKENNITCISKPFDVDELTHAILKLTNNKDNNKGQ